MRRMADSGTRSGGAQYCLEIVRPGMERSTPARGAASAARGDGPTEILHGLNSAKSYWRPGAAAAARRNGIRRAGKRLTGATPAGLLKKGHGKVPARPAAEALTERSAASSNGPKTAKVSPRAQDSGTAPAGVAGGVLLEEWYGQVVETDDQGVWVDLQSPTGEQEQALFETAEFPDDLRDRILAGERFRYVRRTGDVAGRSPEAFAYSIPSVAPVTADERARALDEARRLLAVPPTA